jgi:hypothetical protein
VDRDSAVDKLVLQELYVENNPLDEANLHHLNKLHNVHLGVDPRQREILEMRSMNS